MMKRYTGWELKKKVAYVSRTCASTVKRRLSGTASK